MFKKYFFFYAVITICIAPNSFSQNTKNNSQLEQCIDVLSYSDLLLMSGEGSISYRIDISDSLSSFGKVYTRNLLATSSYPDDELVFHQDKDVFFAFDGIKLRLDFIWTEILPKEFDSHETQKYVKGYYNGEIHEYILMERNMAVHPVFISSGVTNLTTAIASTFNPLIGSYYVDNSTKLSSFLKENINTLKHSNKNVDGIDYETIEYNFAGVDSTIIFYLDPNIFNRPTMIENESNDWYRITKIEYKQYNDDLWFPKRNEEKLYYKDKDSGENILLSTESLVIKNDFQLNIDIPSSTFEAPFETGMRIIDHSNKDVYTYVETNENSGTIRNGE